MNKRDKLFLENLSDQGLIYALIDPREGSKFYIGFTTNLISRYRDHWYQNDASSVEKNKVITAIKEAGLRLGIEVLEELVEGDIPAEKEEYWMGEGLRLGWPLKNKAALLKTQKFSSQDLAKMLSEGQIS